MPTPGLVSNVAAAFRAPVTAARDFSRKRRLAREMLDRLARVGRPGGVDVTRLDDEGVAALMHLLHRRRDVAVVKNRHHLTLMFTEDVDVSFSPEVTAIMRRGRVIATPTEDLFAGEPDERRDAGHELDPAIEGTGAAAEWHRLRAVRDGTADVDGR